MTITSKPAAIYDALMAHALLLESQGPKLPVSVPEPIEAFVPPSDTGYIEAANFPNAPAWNGLSRGKVDQGLLLLTVVWPKNDGLIRPMEVAGAIEAHFAMGLKLFSAGRAVKISAEPYTVAPVVEPDSVRIPVTVPWTA